MHPMKSGISETGDRRKVFIPENQLPRRARNSLAVLLLILGSALAVWGIRSGDLEAIYWKAVFICMECIGIG